MNTVRSWSVAAAFCAAAAVAAPASAEYSFEGSNVQNATIRFVGTNNLISFIAGIGGADFKVTDGNSPSLIGTTGDFSGSWQVSNTIITTPTPFGPMQMAAVTGTGGFSIVFGGGTFSGDLTWDTVSSFGTLVGLNLSGIGNLVNMSYTGTDPYLAGLASQDEASVTLSAQFTPARTLTELTANGRTFNASYSFAVYAVPEPSTYALIGAGLVGVGLSLRGRRQGRRRIG